jgi:sodium-dependent dicarboxylate transporter 2/3/5
MKMTKKNYVHLFIMIALTVVISLLPPFGKITPVGMKTLAIFVSVLYGWLTYDLILPSIYGFFGLTLLGIMGSADALSVGLGNTQVVAILAAMAFSGAMEAVGVTRMLANWMLTQKTFRKSPWILVSAIIGTAYVLGLAGAGLAAIMLIWATVMDIAREGEFEKGDSLITFMILMVIAAAFSGGFAIPFHAISLIFTAYFTQTTGLTFAIGPFVAVAIPTTVTVLVLMVLSAKFIFRLDANKFSMSDEIVARLEQQKVEKPAKIGLVVLVLYMLALILPSTFPTMPGAKLLNALGIAGVSLIGMFVLAIISINGERILDLPRTWTRSIDWSLVLLLAVTFPLAEAMRAADAGIMPTIVGLVMPIVSKMGATTFIIVCMVILGILTQVTHNIVLAAMFTPFLVPLCAQLGGNPYVMFFVMYFALNASYMTPAASFQSAMAHAHEAVDSKWCYIYGILFSIFTWIVLVVITMPLGNMIYA